ncbi:hypothetical protein HA466_0032930 [Hirschfeldia incana]|nr:hypothetical protein HA466_0032930 [Hirschfeldia incana]
MAVQLVLIEAVPSLLCVVRDGGSSGSEEEPAEDEELCVDDDIVKKSINTSHVRDIDSACKALVNSIISAGVDLENFEPNFSEADDEQDELVDNLIKAIEEGFSFSNSNFKGGATTGDANRMREDAKKENLNRQTGKAIQKHSVSDGFNAEHVATLVKNSVAAEVCKIGTEVKDLDLSLGNSQNIFQKNMLSILSNFQNEMVKVINTPCNRPHVLEPVQTQQCNIGTDSNGLLHWMLLTLLTTQCTLLIKYLQRTITIRSQFLRHKSVMKQMLTLRSRTRKIPNLTRTLRGNTWSKLVSLL